MIDQRRGSLLGVVLLVCIACPAFPLAAQSRADSIDVVQAVLIHLRSTDRGSIFVGSRSAPLVQYADSLLDGPSRPGAERDVICPGSTPIPGDSIGQVVSVSLMAKPQQEPDSTRIPLDLGWWFRIDGETAGVPVSFGCYRTQLGGGGMAVQRGGRWLQGFSHGSFFDLAKDGGIWKVIRTRFMFIS